MNFKTAVLSVTKDNKTKGAKAAREQKHPLLWRALQAKVSHMYEKDTGNKAPSDWSGILDWLVANLPAILKLIMMLFGA